MTSLLLLRTQQQSGHNSERRRCCAVPAEDIENMCVFPARLTSKHAEAHCDSRYKPCKSALSDKYDTLEQKERRRRCFEAARDPNISSAKGCAQRLKGHSNLFCEELFYMYYIRYHIQQLLYYIRLQFRICIRQS